jgi:hypothetical protein
MAWSQEQIDILKAAIASGVLKVKYADREVTYHSLTEMRSLLSEMQGSVAAAAGTSNYSLISTRKGL